MVFISVLAPAALKPGKTDDDLIAAWYPDKGFGISGRGPILAAERRRRQRILAIAFIDLPDGESLDVAMARIDRAGAAAPRPHRRGGQVRPRSAASIEVADQSDFSTDATVAAGRPPR